MEALTSPHPVRSGIEKRPKQIGHGANGLQPIAESADGARDGLSPATSRAPTFQALMKFAGSMQAEINKGTRQTSEQNHEQPATGMRLLNPFFAGSGIKKAAGKQQETNDEEEQRGGEIECALQHPDSEHAGDSCVAFLSEKERTNRLANAREKKNRGKSHQRGAIGFPESGSAHIPGKTLPAQRANRVTAIDGDDGKKQKRDIRQTDAVDKFFPGEVREMNLVTGMISERAKSGDHDEADKKFAVIGAHPCGETNRSLSACQESRR